MSRQEYLRYYYQLPIEQKEEQLVAALIFILGHRHTAHEREEQARIDATAAELLAEVDI